MASSNAASRYSSSRPTAGRCVDATPCLGPWDRHGGARIEAVEPRSYLLGPRRFRVGVDVGIEALNQLACQGRPLFIGQPERFSEELFGIHKRKGNTCG